MWTVVVFISLLCLPCTVSRSLPSPTNVSFSSVNLRNILHWIPGNGTPDGTHFTVEYAIYGDSIPGSKGKRVQWRVVQQCTEIVRTWCDLSTETWDVEQGYHARVRALMRRAFSKWALTERRFDPKSETTFGPPMVSVEIEDNSAIISLKGPMRYQSNNQTPAMSMKAIYPHMTYDLSIHNTHRNQTHHFPVVNNSYKYRLLEYSTVYCFSAQSRFISMPVRCQSSAWYCMTTPQDPVIEQLRQVLVGIVVPSLFICIIVVAGYLLYFYLSGKGQKSPYMLNPHSFHQSPLTFPPDNRSLIVVSVIKSEPPSSDPPCPEPPPRIPDPPPRYSPQRSEAPIGPQKPLDDLSIDYGAVCTLVQADPWSQEVTTLHQARLLSVQGSVTGGLSVEMEDRDVSGLFISRHPRTVLFDVPASLQREERGQHMDTNTGEEEGKKCESVPLLSSYISQNIRNMVVSHSDQSDCLATDYGVLMPATTQNREENDSYKMEEEAICINWDPETRKLVLPVLEMKFNKEEELDGPMPSNRQEESRMAGNDEEMYMPKGELKLENVFVRQTSEEEAETQKELEGGEETRWEANDLLTKWDLVVSMDQ